MQYVALIYQGSTPLPGTPEWDALPVEEQKAVYDDYAALNETPGVTPGLPLGLAADASTVQVSGGRTITTDGPFAEKEAVGGWFVVEADDLDAALAIAARVPAARLGGAVEIRPVQTYW